MSLSTHDCSGLSHDIVLPGTVDNSVLSLIISVLSFKGIHNGICNSLYVCKPVARVDVDNIAFSSSLFSDKVDNTDGSGLNQLQMDAFGCMVQGSFLTHSV